MIITRGNFPLSEHLPIEIIDADDVGVKFTGDHRRMWICVNGVCVLRIKQSGEKQIRFDLPHRE